MMQNERRKKAIRTLALCIAATSILALAARTNHAQSSSVEHLLPMTIAFSPGTQLIARNDETRLRLLAHALAQPAYNGWKLRLTGYADSTHATTEQNRQRLIFYSQQRAIAVRNYLGAQGLTDDRFVIVAAGAASSPGTNSRKVVIQGIQPREASGR